MKDEQAIRQMLSIFEVFGDKPDAVVALKWVLGEWPTPQPPVTCEECAANSAMFEALKERIKTLTAANDARQRTIEELQIAAIKEKEGK